MIPRQRWEPAPGLDNWSKFETDYDGGAVRYRGAWAIPTVDQVADAIAMMTADTVLQILRGQGVTYGLGAAVGSTPYARPAAAARPGAAAARTRAWRARQRATDAARPAAAAAATPAEVVHVIPRRNCVWCFQSVQVRPDGTLAEHWDWNESISRCLGSGR